MAYRFLRSSSVRPALGYLRVQSPFVQPIRKTLREEREGGGRDGEGERGREGVKEGDREKEGGGGERGIEVWREEERKRHAHRQAGRQTETETERREMPVSVKWS